MFALVIRDVRFIINVVTIYLCEKNAAGSLLRTL